MTIIGRVAKWFTRQAPPEPVPLPANPFKGEPLTPPPLIISEQAIEAMRRSERPSPKSPFTGLPKPPPGVRPESSGMAMDDALTAQTGAWNAWATGGLWGEGLYFPGYPYLAELAQRPEYRHITETFAEEMTRKWLTLKSTGTTDKTDKIKALTGAMVKYNLRGVFNRAIELDGTFGMGLIYIDTGATDDPDELVTPLLIDQGKIEKGSLRGFVPVDPTWVSPVAYNSIDPLKPDFYIPSIWYVMGKRVHASRLLIVRGREVPDILKASYNFGGLSLQQMAKPYVDNWLRTRQSVSDLLHSFTVFVFKTNMMAYVQDAKAFANRLMMFVLGRDNRGLFAVDKETEDFANISAPLGTLDHLQSQAQEQMASVSQIPLIKLLGITPTGLNATGEDEIRIWYDRVHAKQESVLGDLVTTALQVIQLSETGAIDPEIVHEFAPLWELDEAGRAAVEKMKADTGAVLMAGAVISNEEERARIAADPGSDYQGLSGPAPEPEPDPMEPDEEDDADKIGNAGASGSEKGANSGE